MSTYSSYKKGDWSAVCDSCGMVFLASKLRKRWDGLMVCSKDFEVRHPQDFVRAKVDIQAVRWTRPESTDVFIGGSGPFSIAGYAIAGTMIAGNTTNPGLVPEGTFTV